MISTLFQKLAVFNCTSDFWSLVDLYPIVHFSHILIRLELKKPELGHVPTVLLYNCIAGFNCVKKTVNRPIKYGIADMKVESVIVTKILDQCIEIFFIKSIDSQNKLAVFNVIAPWVNDFF